VEEKPGKLSAGDLYAPEAMKVPRYWSNSEADFWERAKDRIASWDDDDGNLFQVMDWNIT
jgi:hypothetical protein